MTNLNNLKLKYSRLERGYFCKWNFIFDKWLKRNFWLISLEIRRRFRTFLSGLNTFQNKNGIQIKRSSGVWWFSWRKLNIFCPFGKNILSTIISCRPFHHKSLCQSGRTKIILAWSPRTFSTTLARKLKGGLAQRVPTSSKFQFLLKKWPSFLWKMISGKLFHLFKIGRVFFLFYTHFFKYRIFNWGKEES